MNKPDVAYLRDAYPDGQGNKVTQGDEYEEVTPESRTGGIIGG